MSERAYIAHDGLPEEGACVVFAPSAKEAKAMAWPVISGWNPDAEWTDLRVRLLPGDCAHLRQRDGPHVNDSPPCCSRCERWSATPLVDGLCEDCRKGTP